MDIQLINLDRNAGRLGEFLVTNPHLSNVHRFPAIDGSSISRKKFCDHGIFRSEMAAYSNGAVGCALSHLALWQKAVLTIAADDGPRGRRYNQCVFSVRRCGNRIASAGLGHCSLGLELDSILHFNFLPGVSPCLRNLFRARVEEEHQPISAALLETASLSSPAGLWHLGYSISPGGAEKFASHCLPIREMDVFCPGLNRAVPNFGIDHDERPVFQGKRLRVIPALGSQQE